MTSKVQQNRVGIQLALSCLARNRFLHVHANRPQGTFPNAHITAERDGRRYLIGVTGREEIGADGEYNPSYNVVQTESDLQEARNIADSRQAMPAFVAIALSRTRGTYSAYFQTLEAVEYRRSIPMLLGDRTRYEQLARDEHDSRVADLE